MRKFAKLFAGYAAIGAFIGYGYVLMLDPAKDNEPVDYSSIQSYPADKPAAEIRDEMSDAELEKIERAIRILLEKNDGIDRPKPLSDETREIVLSGM